MNNALYGIIRHYDVNNALLIMRSRTNHTSQLHCAFMQSKFEITKNFISIFDRKKAQYNCEIFWSD